MGRAVKPNLLIGAVTLAAAVLLPASAQAATTKPRAANGKVCTIVGTAKNDRLVGRPGADVLCGLGGNDVLVGGAGDDVLDGGTGDDTLTGGSGRDTLYGESGDDTVRGEDGDDRLSGGDGDDDLDGGRGADRISSGRGRDRCRIRSEDVSPADACVDDKQAQLLLDTAEWQEGGGGGQRIELTVRATDDRSGVKSVDAVVQGPEGTIVLTGTRHGSGSRNESSWRLRGKVPAGGEWRLQVLTVADRAGHLTHYWGDAEGAYTTDLAGVTGSLSGPGPFTVRAG